MPKQTIMLIEDNQDDSNILLSNFRHWGISNAVVSINSPTKVLSILNSSIELPIAIFLDLSLPEMSGTDLLKEIRLIHRCALIPVIILTGDQSESGWNESFLSGANGYLTKPIQFDGLYQTALNVGLKWELVK